MIPYAVSMMIFIVAKRARVHRSSNPHGVTPYGPTYGAYGSFAWRGDRLVSIVIATAAYKLGYRILGSQRTCIITCSEVTLIRRCKWKDGDSTEYLESRLARNRFHT